MGDPPQTNPLAVGGPHQRVRFAEQAPDANADADSGLAIYSPAAANPHRKLGDAEAVPEVYWADDRDNDTIDTNNVANNDANLAQYTFYREGTPTPPEFDGREKEPLGHGAAAGVGAGVAGVRDAEGDNGRSYPIFGNAVHDSNWSSAGSDGSSSRLSKKMLWMLAALAALLLIGIAVGVGVGVGLSKKRANDESLAMSSFSPSPTTIRPGSALTAATPDPSSSTSTTTETTETTSSKSSTSSLSQMQATSTAVPATSKPAIVSDCPAANNTIYQVPGSTKSFLRLCGVDYSGSGATDILNVTTTNMAQCMDRCATLDKCTGCGWGFIAGDVGDAHRCWMKTALKTGHEATTDWCFAILR